jgi:hypothetical protein
MRVSPRESVTIPAIIVSHKVFYSRFSSTARDPVYTLVLFLRPAIPWKCGFVRSREDSVPSHVLVI